MEGNDICIIMSETTLPEYKIAFLDDCSKHNGGKGKSKETQSALASLLDYDDYDEPKSERYCIKKSQERRNSSMLYDQAV